MIETSPDIIKLTAALVKAQGEMGAVAKDGANPAFKRQNGNATSYATLEAVIEAAKPALQANDLAFIQAPGSVIDGALEVTTMIVHGASGQWMRFTLHVPLQQKTAQGVGSAITYARRYSLMSALGLPAEDDDGNEASKPPQKPVQPKQEKPKAETPFDDPATPTGDPDAVVDDLSERARLCTTNEQLDAMKAADEFKRAYASLPDSHKKMVGEFFTARRQGIAKGA
jgi:hypothetical protein